LSKKGPLFVRRLSVFWSRAARQKKKTQERRARIKKNGGNERAGPPINARNTRSNETEATDTNTAAADEEATGTTQTYNESTVKIPIPFLAIAALECGSSDPLDIIIAIKRASNDFDDAHKDAEGKESSEDATAVE